ncbi:Major pollen allergen Ole e 10 [Morella rubra]|uniref:Major pollen allergen Ole e 10 n=1 Tax=Morella rubra TaxID=262757 RepID=A0A6A1US81_9ROSI|nr:Major pollen allergen Ole e 10 [Morella rubra]
MKIARVTLAMFLPLALAFLLSLCACTAEVKQGLPVQTTAMAIAFRSSFFKQGLISLSLTCNVLQRPRVVPNSWCIAKPSADTEKLFHNVEYSCEQTHVNCSSIQLGGSCFHPNNAASHASFAMNLFYQAAGKHQWDCHFNGTGLVIFVNPCKLYQHVVN